jgi:CheY-like chemotaxis protein
MAHFLVADDRDRVRAQFALWLKQNNHTFQEAVDILDVLDKVELSEQVEPFDLILLDHDFGGGEYGYMALEKLEPHYREHRVLVITANPDEELGEIYAELGAIGHLIKDITRAQFNVTLRSALKRRERFLMKQDWEQAIEVLEHSGILGSYEQLSQDYAGLSTQLDNLRSINEQLQEELSNAGSQEAKLSEAYARASESLKKLPGNHKVIYPLLKDYYVTEAFINDVEHIFSHDRLMFCGLMESLQKIRENPKYRIKKLAGTDQAHYEYYVRRSYRLYILLPNASSATDRATLCRFSKKEDQPQTIDNLCREMKLAYLD